MGKGFGPNVKVDPRYSVSHCRELTHYGSGQRNNGGDESNLEELPISHAFRTKSYQMDSQNWIAKPFALFAAKPIIRTHLVKVIYIQTSDTNPSMISDHLLLCPICGKIPTRIHVFCAFYSQSSDFSSFITVVIASWFL